MAGAVKDREQEEGTGEPREVRDGSIDFTRYSLEQLNDLRFTLDRNAFPANYANLLQELQRRASHAQQPQTAEPSHGLGVGTQRIRFTAHDGLRGWLEAKSRWLALYGEGFIEIRQQEIVLGGWQRNWLGVAERSELFIPLDTLSDVIQGDGGSGDGRRESDWVRFRHQSTWGRYRFIEFQAGTVEEARALVESLPKTRSDGYERWTAVREFDTQLREVGVRPWITLAIVLANLAVFAATALAAKRFDLMASPLMVEWGANFAPLTLHGQWWRLLTALFLHGGIAHVLLNMWALWNVGRLTERLYGSGAFAFLYFACGALSGLASIVWDPTHATLGASGAIFGVFAAFIVYALQARSRAAVRVPASLWVSSLVFALYNLTAGFFTPGIDNAAHVGGALSGVVLGACLARPLTLAARQRFPVERMVVAAGVAAVLAAAAIWQATGLGDQLTGPERYLSTHQWYVNGETENLRRWQEIAVQAGSGQLSDSALGDSFETQIAPFWEEATARMKKEQVALPADEREYGAVAADYSQLRARWARAIVALARGDRSHLADLQRYEIDSNLAAARSERLTLLSSLNHRRRALASSPWLLAAGNWLTGRHWKCVESPYRSQRLDSADSATDGPAARHAAGCRAQSLFMSGDYVTLDHWMEQSADSLEDLPDGGSTLDGIMGGFFHLLEYGTLEVVPALGRTADWRRRVPGSVYPELIQSVIFDSWAWGARGNGYAKSVSPQAWAAFGQRAEMAAMSLEQVVERANTNPIWYEMALDVGLDRSRPRDELRSTFKRGVTESPGYWPLYSRMLRILMPRWGGSAEEIGSFIKETSLRPNGEVNVARYARLYWSYASLEDDDLELFGQPLADWPTMKQGLAELQRQYPKSDLILNAYAKFGCMAGDEASYREVRPQLRDRLSRAAWSEKVSLQLCDGKFPVAAAEAVTGGTQRQSASPY